MKLFEIFLRRESSGEDAKLFKNLSSGIVNLLVSLGESDFGIVFSNFGIARSIVVNIGEIHNLILSGLFSDEISIIRSLTSCRFIYFGYDRQFYFCCSNDDNLSFIDGEIWESIDVSEFLIQTDSFDSTIFTNNRIR